MNTRNQQRLTIGLLTDWIEQRYQAAVYAGIADVVAERDVNLICFVIGSLREPYDFIAQRNVIADLVGPENVDGLIVMAGALSNYISRSELLQFLERYRALPQTSIAMPLHGVPSILVDNKTGLRTIISHLVEAHNRRRIAFIRGPGGHPEAEERFEAYQETLASHHLPFDPQLVAEGDFSWESGARAIHVFLDECHLRPGTSFDAVVAANDFMALSALEEMKVLGVRIPHDVAVVGFDDIEETECITPALTTVRQPFYHQGEKAATMLLDLLAGERVPEMVRLPSEPVIRRSCGCLPHAVVQVRAETTTIPEKEIPTSRETTLTAMQQALGDWAETLPAAWHVQLLDAFTAEIENRTANVFVHTLDTLLQVAPLEREAAATWHQVLSILYRHVMPAYQEDGQAQARADILWQQGRILIGETALQTQAYQAFQSEREAIALSEVNARLITTFEIPALMDTIAQGLPRLQIPACYLSLYEEDEPIPSPQSRLLLAHDDRGRQVVAPGQRFPSRQLAPQGLLPTHRRYTLAVLPLFFREEHLGFVLFETGQRVRRVYEILRRQISSALKGALLSQAREQARADLETAYEEVEKQVEERTTELQREIAQRERLQQEIIAAQQRAIQELSTPLVPISDDILVLPLVGAIDGQRAQQIMEVVLAGTTSRQAQVVIMDITGVPLVDTHVANYLLQATQALRLVGAACVLVGITPQVAQTLVKLGVDLRGLVTRSDLQSGVEYAQRLLSQRRSYGSED